MSGPTQLFGQVLLAGERSMRDYPLSAAEPVLPAAANNSDRISEQPPVHALFSNATYTLAFGFKTHLFNIPASANDRHVGLRNLTAAQLPQLLAPLPQNGSDNASAAGSAAAAYAASATALTAGSFTLLLWPFAR